MTGQPTRPPMDAALVEPLEAVAFAQPLDAAAPTESAALVWPCDALLLERVLRCYKPHARYLRAMTVSTDGSTAYGRAELGIDESCYIDETGHLNAVEVMIGYNQMLYYIVAAAVRHRFGPVFAAWSMEDFWRIQLAGILITRVAMEFRQPVDPRRFRGEFTLIRVIQRRPRAGTAALTVLDTSFRFWDDGAGRSSGQVTVAIVDK